MRYSLLVAASCLILGGTVTAQGQSTADPLVITTNPYVGAPVSKYDSRVSPYSPDGALNPYTTGGGRVYGADGTYLGRLNANKYDPESVSNPYGQYGSKYSPTSINNPYSAYGSPYSPTSATNPYATQAPRVYYNTQPAANATGYQPYKYEPYKYEPYKYEPYKYEPYKP